MELDENIGEPIPEQDAPPQADPLDQYIESNPNAQTSLDERIEQRSAFKARESQRNLQSELQQRDFALYGLQQQIAQLQDQLSARSKPTPQPSTDDWDDGGDPMVELKEARDLGDTAAEIKALNKLVDNRMAAKVPELTEETITERDTTNQQVLVQEHQKYTEQLQWMLEQAGLRQRLMAEAGQPDGSLDDNHPLVQQLNAAYRENTLSSNGLLGERNWRQAFGGMKGAIVNYLKQQAPKANSTAFKPSFGSPTPQTGQAVKSLFQQNPNSKSLEYTGGDIPDRGFVDHLDSEQAKAVQNHFDKLFSQE